MMTTINFPAAHIHGCKQPEMCCLSRFNRQSSLTNWTTWDKLALDFTFGVRL